MKTYSELCNGWLKKQMTASHLPYTRNGLKFFTKRGGLRSSEMEEICDRAARKYATKRMGLSGRGLARQPPPARVDFMSAYAEHLRDIIKERVSHPDHYETPLKGFKVKLVLHVTYYFIIPSF